MIELTDEDIKGVHCIDPDVPYEFFGGKTAKIVYRGCNLKCPYCPEEVRTHKYDSGGITLFHFNQTINKLLKEGCDQIVLGGAEPSFFTGSIALSYWLKNKGFSKIKVITNGLRPEILQRMNLTNMELVIRSSYNGYPHLLGAPGSVARRIINATSLCAMFENNGAVVFHCVPDILGIKEINALKTDFLRINNIIVKRGTGGEKFFDEKQIDDIRKLLRTAYPNVQVRW